MSQSTLPIEAISTAEAAVPAQADSSSEATAEPIEPAPSTVEVLSAELSVLPAPLAAPVAVRRTAAERLALASFVLATTASLLLVAFKVFQRFDIATLYDDAYIFQRYAHNLLRGRGIVWNPEGPPSYGVTSVLFLLISVPARVVAAGRPALAALLSSLAAGVAFLALSAWLVRAASEAPRAVRNAMILLFFFCVGVSQTPNHFVGGMDCAFAMAFLAGYLVVAAKLQRTPTTTKGAVLGVLGGAAFAVRPELLVFALLVPFAVALLGPTHAHKRAGRVAVVVTSLVLLAYLTFARIYFQTMLPLTFFAKGLDLYGPEIKRSYRGKTTLELLAFASAYWPLFALVAVDILSGVRAWFRETTPIEKAVFFGTAVLLVYMWFFVLPIMGYDQRFYHPVLPAVLLLATRSAWRLVLRVFDGVEPSARAVHLAVSAAAAVLGFWLCPACAKAGEDATNALVQERNLHLNLAAFSRTTGPQKNWFKPDLFSALPDDAVMATTEVGMVSALAPERPIIDLAGLNDRDFALRRFSASKMFARGAPDILYLPHPDYRNMIKDILRNPHIKDEYELYSAGSLGALFGLAIRKTSPHYRAMKAIVGARAPIPPERYDR